MEPHVTAPSPPGEPPVTPRRNFLIEGLATLIGAVITLVPVGAGVFFFMNPLRKKASEGAVSGSEGFVKVAALDSVPLDGTPVMFPVIADRVDAWNTFPNQPIGAVWLRRPDKEKPETLEAFNVTCPHLGCPVDFEVSQNCFHCPCHDSNFSLDGKRTNRTPPRDMDSLDVDSAKLAQGEVWIKYQDFRTGEPHKIPKS
ncbi:MAG TPA: Rieske 2Fe-2S domain-containing protein [Planctomycetaceae bacterium]|nr:Rieske 2Fe-2S domain-containing protein [Planctomycetaceae bacterium]